MVEVVLAVSALVIAAQALGLFGWFTRAGLLIAVLAMAAVAVGFGRRRERPPPPSGAAPPSPSAPRWALPLALIVAAVAVLHWGGGVESSLGAGIYRQDSTWYHLPVSAGFFQTGDTWSLHLTDPMALTAWFYPMNSELLHAVGMLAFGNDTGSPLVNVVWMALALLAGWCAGRPYGAGAPALVAVALVLDSEMMLVQAGNAPSDTAGTFFLLAAVAVLLNAGAAAESAASELPAGALLVAALAAGLAIGTKITLLAPVAALSVGVLVLSRRGSRLGAAAIWLGGVVLTGGYWYARNLARASNPLPWVSAGPLSGPDQVSLYPRTPHSVADYVTHPGAWVDQFFPSLARTLGPLWPLLAAAAVAGLLLALARGRPLHRIVAAAGIAAAVAYVFIPVSAAGSFGHPSGFETNLRYLAPALTLGAVLLALEWRPRGRRRHLPVAALTALFAVGAISSSTWQAGQVPGSALLVLAILATPIAVAWAWRNTPPLTAVALGLGAVVAFAAIAYPAQRAYLRDRYRPARAPAADNPGFRDTPQWRRLQAWALGVHGARIGVVGPPAAFGQYVFYGSDLSNTVRYLGEARPHGGYRPIEDCATWRRTVDRQADRFVVITPAATIGPGTLPQESLWTRGSPAAHEILHAGPASVYRIDGRLEAADCAREALPPVIRVPGGGFAVPATGLGGVPR